MYKINSIGYIGLLITISIMLFSCKKEENKSSSTGTPTVLISELVGMYVNTDTDVITNDTIYIYQDGINYKMTCPDNNAQPIRDTLIIGITNNNINIPSQSIYGTSGIFLNGDGLLTGSLLSLNWTAGVYTKTGIAYYKQ